MLIFSRGFQLLAFIFFLSVHLYGQDVLYHGVVMDNNHIPIVGVKIATDQNTMTITDANGNFQIKIMPPCHLTYSFS